jgi:N-acetylglutamate synthase-like GNAT family acetyltransferase
MSSVPTIRSGTPEDVAAVKQLLKQPVDDAALTPIPGKRHLIVLDNPTGGIAAAAVLAIDGHHGHLSLFAVDERLVGHGLEDRLLAVIEAMCEAFGLRTLDVPARRAA